MWCISQLKEIPKVSFIDVHIVQKWKAGMVEKQSSQHVAQLAWIHSITVASNCIIHFSATHLYVQYVDCCFANKWFLPRLFGKYQTHWTAEEWIMP